MELKVEITVRLGKTPPEDADLQETTAYIQSCRTMFELQQKLKKEKEGDAR